MEKTTVRSRKNSRIRLEVHETPGYQVVSTLPIVSRYLDGAHKATILGGDDKLEIQAQLEPLEEQIRQAVTHSEETQALDGFQAVVTANLSPFRYYLEENGAELEEHTRSQRPWLQKFGAQLWRDMAKRALDQARDEQVVVTPLLLQLLNSAHNTANGLAAIQNSHETAAAILDLPIGEGLDEALLKVRRWAKDASVEELKAFAKVQDNVAKTSALLSDPNTLQQIAPLLDYALAEALENASLTKESTETLLDLALLFTARTGDRPRRFWQLPIFWQKVADRGVKLHPGQVSRVLMLAQQCANMSGEDAFGTAIAIAHIREAGTDRRIREALLSIDHGEAKQLDALKPTIAALTHEETSTLIKTHLIASSQGEAFVTLIKDLASQPSTPTSTPTSTHPYLLTCLSQRLREATAWNLKGVSAVDLLPLVQYPDELIRADGRKLMVNLMGRDTKHAGRTDAQTGRTVP